MNRKLLGCHLKNKTRKYLKLSAITNITILKSQGYFQKMLKNVVAIFYRRLKILILFRLCSTQFSIFCLNKIDFYHETLNIYHKLTGNC